MDPSLRLENLLESSHPWIPPANPDALAGDLAVPPTEEVLGVAHHNEECVDVAHNMNTKRAKTQQNPNSSKKILVPSFLANKREQKPLVNTYVYKICWFCLALMGVVTTFSFWTDGSACGVWKVSYSLQN